MARARLLGCVWLVLVCVCVLSASFANAMRGIETEETGGDSGSAAVSLRWMRCSEGSHVIKTLKHDDIIDYAVEDGRSSFEAIVTGLAPYQEVSKVDFFVDGKWIRKEGAAPYFIGGDYSDLICHKYMLPSGRRTLMAIAYDDNESEIARRKVHLNVLNSTA